MTQIVPVCLDQIQDLLLGSFSGHLRAFIICKILKCTSVGAFYAPSLAKLKGGNKNYFTVALNSFKMPKLLFDLIRSSFHLRKPTTFGKLKL